jgi:hypothetical protein
MKEEWLERLPSSKTSPYMNTGMIAIGENTGSQVFSWAVSYQAIL